jgi:hypothetical protein
MPRVVRGFQKSDAFWETGRLIRYEPVPTATWIEITGTEGSLFLDDSQRDNWLNTVAGGMQFPMSTMPG